MEMYRLRSAERLLREYAELEPQSIFLASSDEFNDPLEGNYSLKFQGDTVVWHNLFKHFLLCMDLSFTIVMVPDGDIEKLNFPIHVTESGLKTDLHKQRFSKIKTRFFDHKEIKLLIGYLSSRTTPLTKELLFPIFSLITDFALESITFSLDEFKMLPPGNLPNLLQMTMKTKKEMIRSFIPAIKKLEEPLSNLVINELGRTIHETQLNMYSSSETIADSRNLGNFIFNFPERYLQNIQHLVYHNWFAASFMGCFPERMDLWSHYADSHKGACLIFRTKSNSTEENFTLEFERGPNHQLNFEKVEYINSKIEIDFFKQIWTLNVKNLNTEWYTGLNGEKSKLWIENPIKEEERKLHWNIFSKIKTQKTIDWRQEAEYRICIDASFGDPPLRTFKYEFESLEGIVFGINTSLNDKISIINIVREKCRVANREKFSFYQARYCHSEEKIVKDKLNIHL